MALASFCIVSDTELVQAVAPKLAEKLPEVDILLTAEAKGIILTYEMSRLLGKEFVVARKNKKPYMQNVLEANVYSITTQKKQTLYLDGCDVEKIKGKRVACLLYTSIQRNPKDFLQLLSAAEVRTLADLIHPDLRAGIKLVANRHHDFFF